MTVPYGQGAADGALGARRRHSCSRRRGVGGAGGAARGGGELGAVRNLSKIVGGATQPAGDAAAPPLRSMPCRAVTGALLRSAHLNGARSERERRAARSGLSSTSAH